MRAIYPTLFAVYINFLIRDLKVYPFFSIQKLFIFHKKYLAIVYALNCFFFRYAGARPFSEAIFYLSEVIPADLRSVIKNAGQPVDSPLFHRIPRIAYFWTSFNFALKKEKQRASKRKYHLHS